MDFLGIGPWEILLILILALILLGPGKITEIAGMLGKALRTIRKASSVISSNIVTELESTQNKPSSTNPKEMETEEKPLAKIQTSVSNQDTDSTELGETPLKNE